MPERERHTLDDVLEELKTALREKKRDKVLAKIDSLFFVLVTLATFLSGIVVTWHQALAKYNVMIAIIGVLTTLIWAFVVGFKGMVNDDIDTRIYSWSILFNSSLWFASMLAMVILKKILNGFQINGTPLYLIVTFLVSFLVGFLQFAFVKRFISWVENRLTTLLNESVKTSANIQKKAYRTSMIILGISLILGIILESFIMKYLD